MEKQVLSIEQMQELKELGIDITSASMKWAPKLRWDENGEKREVYGHILDINYTPIGAPFWETMDGKDTIPTFTLQDIINLLPHYIEDKEIGRFDYELRVKKDGVIYESYDVYDELGDSFVLNDYNIYDDECKTILDCAFKMLKWCINEGYITREKISNFPN